MRIKKFLIYAFLFILSLSSFLLAKMENPGFSMLFNMMTAFFALVIIHYQILARPNSGIPANFFNFWMYCFLSGLFFAISQLIGALNLYFELFEDSIDTFFFQGTYFLSGFCICLLSISLMILARKRRKASSMTSGMFFLYIVFLLIFITTIFWDKAIILFSKDNPFTDYLFVGMDTLILISAVIFLFSTSMYPVSFSIKLIFSGVVLFLIKDISLMYWNIPFFSGDALQYWASSLPFVFFTVASMQDVAQSSANCHLFEMQIQDFEKAGNRGREKKQNIYFIQALVLLPLLIYPMFSGKVVPTLVGSGLVAFYLLIGNITQNNVSGYQFIEMEKRINHALDELVKQRSTELIELNEALQKQTLIDPLTGIYNRRHYVRTLDTMIEEGKTFYIIGISINRLRRIGETYGHHVGDFIIQMVASRMGEILSSEDSLFYIANNEFAIVSSSLEKEEELKAYIKKIISKIKEPIDIHSYQFVVEVSVSVTKHPEYADTRENLMKYSNMALRKARSYAMPNCIFFDENMKNEIDRRKRLELSFKSAEKEKEMEVLYQPQFDIVEKKLIGMETFLVWNHPTEGVIRLEEFLSGIDSYDLITEAGSFALERVFRDIKRWNENCPNHLKVSINIPAKQLRSPQFLQEFLKAMSECGVKAEWIELQVSENTVMLSFDYIVDLFQHLTQNGICISMDEFGEGYSSLSAIKQLHIHRLKISESLTHNINGRKGQMIVRAIIMMAEGLGLEVMADNVDSKEELMLLSKLGCRKIQGDCLGIPVSARVFEKLYLKDDKLKK